MEFTRFAFYVEFELGKICGNPNETEIEFVRIFRDELIFLTINVITEWFM